jgi:hypothetical protein
MPIAAANGIPLDVLRHLGQLAEADPVNPAINHDLRVLAIADIAAENAGAAFPQDRHIGLPDRADFSGR